jgi:hypothetical protein
MKNCSKWDGGRLRSLGRLTPKLMQLVAAVIAFGATAPLALGSDKEGS